MSNLYSKILDESCAVDKRFESASENDLISYKLNFNVPTFHPRHKKIKTYFLEVVSLSEENFNDSQLIFIDRGLTNTFVNEILPKSGSVFFEDAKESTFKEWNWLNQFMKDHRIVERKVREVVGIGGGLTLNVSSYVAELLDLPLVLIPSTVIGMADGSGGKVRLNLIDRGRFFKHYYKSFYEPDKILIDPRFLNTLTEGHVSTGLGEVIKHAIYQSPSLLKYLLSNDFKPFTNRLSLLKVILWTANLKEVCINIDVEENANGSRRILRGGHELSDRLEEDTHFEIPHGDAVTIGMYREMELSNNNLLPLFVEFCDKFKLPKTVGEFKSIKKSSCKV